MQILCQQVVYYIVQWIMTRKKNLYVFGADTIFPQFF
jgi:hypothetical protein